MRPAEQYAEMAEKAINKAGDIQDTHPTVAMLHMMAAQTLSNLSVAAAYIESNAKWKRPVKDVEPQGGYL